MEAALRWFGARRARYREILAHRDLARFAHEMESLSATLQSQVTSLAEQLESERVKARILERERDMLIAVCERNVARIEAESRIALKSAEPQP